MCLQFGAACTGVNTVTACQRDAWETLAWWTSDVTSQRVVCDVHAMLAVSISKGDTTWFAEPSKRFWESLRPFCNVQRLTHRSPADAHQHHATNVALILTRLCLSDRVLDLPAGGGAVFDLKEGLKSFVEHPEVERVGRVLRALKLADPG